MSEAIKLNLLWTANYIFALIIAPLMIGIINKVKAFFAGAQRAASPRAAPRHPRTRRKKKRARRRRKIPSHAVALFAIFAMYCLP